MKNKIQNSEKDLSLYLSEAKHCEFIQRLSHALSSPERIDILRGLSLCSATIGEIASKHNLPISSVSRHMDVLENAELVRVSYRPTKKGHMKYYSQNLYGFHVSVINETEKQEPDEAYVAELPVGMFSDVNATPPCGMVNAHSVIGETDNPSVFFLPERVAAERIWFTTGHVSYRFPLYTPRRTYSRLSFSFEICSETFFFNPNWPSDVTVSVNDEDVATIFLAGDFGGRLGKYTSDVWSVRSSQFGLLKQVDITPTGVFVDQALVSSEITFDKLNLFARDSVKLSFAVKETAVHKGGLNLFGKNYGDYPQGIVMTLR